MAGGFANRRSLWQHSHTATIFSAVLLFTAGFLCVLLWQNDIVHTDVSASDPSIHVFNQFSPTVSTFSITYNVAIFGVSWNAVFFVLLFILERDALPLSTEQLRYEVEKAACIVAITGNAVYAVACTALMATLARLAADASSTPAMPGNLASEKAASSAGARRAGQGTTAAMAGIAAAAAVSACVMDWLHAQGSRHRRNIKDQPILPGEDDKEA